MLLMMYAVLGMITGLLSGLFGIGGGVIMVPILSAYYQWIELPEVNIMHFAIGTAMAAMVFSTSASVWSHRKKNGVHWELIPFLLMGSLAGAINGATIADKLDSSILTLIFIAFLTLIGFKMWLYHPKERQAKCPKIVLVVLGFCVGSMSALLGIGGGLILVPALTLLGLRMSHASGTSVAMALPTVSVGAICHAYHGRELGDMSNLVGFHYGHVVIPAAITIGLLSVPFARVGVHLAHTLPSKLVRKGMAVLIFLLVVQMSLRFFWYY